MADVFSSPMSQCSDPKKKQQLKSVDEESSPFQRIEFHLAKKPFKGFNHDGGDFRPETLNPGSTCSRVGTGAAQVVQSGPGLGSGSVSGVKKSDVAEWDPELSFPITFRRIGAGLINMGNTCYLNSVLQCLTYTEPLAAYLQSGRHRNSCHIKNGFCALCAIQEHVSLALQSTKSILPKALVFNLQRISRNFRKSRQEDAHEYMVNLLESMHKCCLPSGVPSESPSAYEKSLVHKIFGGRLRSRVKCMQCSYCSDKLDPFLDLSLEIAKVNSLNKALVNFTAEEQLDGGERQYQCQKCNQKVRAMKQMTIHKPPSVLSIHLKRFRAHDPGQKINKEVQFSPTLDLRPFVSGAYEGDLKYTLYGVLVHCGASTYSGHYYCFVRTSTGIWYSLDDNNVRSVGEMAVLQQKAYMLFYVRDRRNFIPRKPVDVGQKENPRSSGTGNRFAPANNNHLSKELIKKSAVEASAIVPRVPVLREALVNQTNGQMTKDVAPKKEPVSNLRGPLGENTLPSTHVPSSKEGGTSDSLSVVTSTTAAKSNDRSEKATSNGNDGVSVMMSPPSVKDPKIVEASKPVRDEQNNHASAAVNASVVVSSTTVPGGSTLASNPPSSRISQVGSFAGENVVASIPLGQKISDEGQKMAVIDSAKMSNGSLDVEATVCKNPKGLKKKPIKGKGAGMHFRPFLLSRAVLSVRKKKHKKTKHLSSDSKSFSKKYLIENSDLGLSTSETTKTNSLVSAGKKRKRDKSGVKVDEDGTSKNSILNPHDSSMDIKDKESRETLIQNRAVLANDKLRDNGLGADSVALENQSESRVTDDRDAVQNGWTRGPKETIVAPWDGIELPRSHVVESSQAQSITIGYVGDEWDEEYDRGKRKKIKQPKLDPGGPNPFQMLANKNLQAKKTKVERFSSGNHPPRI